MIAERGIGYYSSPKEVLELTNVDPEDFNQVDEQALNDFLIQKLKEAKSIIDRYCNTNFEANGTVDEAIHGIARDIVVNIISSGKISRQIGVVSIEDYPTITDLKIFTDDIKERLNPFKKQASFNLFRVRRRNEVV